MAENLIITRLKFETDEFSNRARRMTTEINDISHKMEVAGNTLDHMNAKNLKLANSFGSVQTASTTLRGKISELQDQFIAWGHHYNMLTEQQKQDPYGRAIVRQLDILRERIQQTKAEMSGLEGQMGGKGGGFMDGIGKGLVPGFGMGVGAAGAMFAVKGIQAAAGLAKDAIKYNIETNMEFEQSNANLAAVLGKSREEMERLTEDAKRLGASTLYTANQITELQTVLARRGFSEEQILQMTHGISNLALATGTNLAQSAELAASTMQAFGMHANEMERIVSVLGVSTTKSALTMEKLGTSLQYVAPTARAAGFSLEDTVAMLGKLVDGGLDASTAGTSLRQILLAMSTDNGKLARSFGRPVRSLEDLVEALDHVSDAEDLLSDASKEVRVTAVPALISLANSRKELKELRGELDNVGGKLQEMADKQTATLRGQITLLTSAWDGFMINLGNSEGTLKKAAKWLQELVSGWSASVALGNNAQSAIGVVFGAWDQHKLEQDPGQAYLNKYNEYMESGNFDYDSKGRKLGEKERERAINEYIRQEYNALFEAEKKATDADIAVLDHYIKNRNNNIRYKDEKGREQTQMGGIYYRQQLVQAIRKYDTEGELKGIEAHDIEGLIKLAAKLLGQKQFNDSFYSGVGQYAQDSLLQLDEKDKTNATLSDKGPEKQAKDKVADAMRRYEEAMNLATIEYQNEVINGEQFLQKKLSAEQSVYKALDEAYNTFADPKIKEAMLEWIGKFTETSANLGELKNRLKALADKLREEEEAARKRKEEEDRKAKQIKQTDTRILNGLMGIARSNKIGYDAVGIGGQKAKIEAGIDIPDKEWAIIAARLNDELQKRGVKWYIDIDFETGTLEKMKAEIQEYMEAVSKGVGGFKSFVGALDSVKKAGENLAEVMESDASAWDKMLAAFDAAMAPMQAMVSIYEALNAMMDASRMISDLEANAQLKNAAAKELNTIAAEKDANQTLIEAGAKEADTGAALMEAGANQVDAASKTMNAHSWIPFIGVAMGAAMVATLIATIASASKGVEFHADGGFIGGGPRGTDTVPMWGTPGELVLNRAQQGNLASQLQASPAFDLSGLHLETEIRADKFRVMLLQNDRRRGGTGNQYRIK